METFFPAGPGGVCHPLNVGGFRLESPECTSLYSQREGTWSGWEEQVRQLSRLAAEAWNCSSVQQCALTDLFVVIGSYATPGFAEPSKFDPWRVRFWEMLAARARRAEQRLLAGMYRRQQRAFEEEDIAAAALASAEEAPAPDEVTLGMHADPASAKGPWRGQLEMWKAYAHAHRLRWILDAETYFDGAVFAKFAGLHWASTNASRAGFHERFEYLASPSSFAWASLVDRELLESLVVFSQPPKYWDSLEAFSTVLSQNKWTVWMDYDFTISPCCFDEFSLRDLIKSDKGGRLPHVIIRDSPREDYSHHCANAGFFIVRNSSIGRLFIELAQLKRTWPGIPYGYQSAMAESLLELLGMEKDWRARSLGRGRSSGSAYRSTCLPFVATLGPRGQANYANFCRCHREELRRLAGPEGDRTSRWVHFVSPGLRSPEAVEPGLLYASFFIYRGSGRGLGMLPLTAWSREQHRAYADAWMPPDAALGGPCAMLPLMVHWASVPHRPRLMYEFVNARFPQQLPLHVLANGSSEEIAQAYRAAAAWGSTLWREFLKRPRAAALFASWGQSSDAPLPSACNVGSGRLWVSGGWARMGRSTQPNSPTVTPVQLA